MLGPGRNTPDSHREVIERLADARDATTHAGTTRHPQQANRRPVVATVITYHCSGRSGRLSGAATFPGQRMLIFPVRKAGEHALRSACGPRSGPAGMNP